LDHRILDLIEPSSLWKLLIDAQQRSQIP